MKNYFVPDDEDLLGLGNDGRPPLTDANGDVIKRFPFYKADPQLARAVNVALLLGRPLLVSGEPGCGKTSLGFAIARKLGVPRLYFFSVKSDSEARSIFYQFDTLRRFQDAHIGRLDGTGCLKNPEAYITYQALGRAILDAHPLDKVEKITKASYEHPGTPRRSVVVIDEIDKAPRDLPNDVLDEIERLTFRIPELDAGGWRAETPRWRDEEFGAFRPIVVITSNSEKQLPDAFLRRCIFHHIKFPREEILEEIALNAIEQRADQENLRLAIRYFMDARKKAVEHRPGTAEFLDLFQAAAEEHRRKGGDFPQVLSECYAAIAKTTDDAERIRLIGLPK